MKRHWIPAFAGMTIWAVICMSLQAEEGKVAGLTLTRVVGARAAGLGEAYSAVSNDVQSIGFNPAALGSLNFPSLSATYNNGIADDNVGNVSYAHPLSFGTFYLGGVYYNAGDFDYNENGVSEKRIAQQDSIGMVGFATGQRLPVSVGVTAKFFKSELAEEATASGTAWDTGLHWRTPISGLALGASYLNAGGKMQYEVDEEDLPQTVRAGLAYDFDLNKINRFKEIPYHILLALDGSKVKNQDGSFNSGLELRRDMVVMEQGGYAALRGGFQSGSNKGTAGIGFQIGGFMLDYALTFAKENNLDEIHRVTLGWQFIPAKPILGHQEKGIFSAPLRKP